MKRKKRNIYNKKIIKKANRKKIESHFLYACPIIIFKIIIIVLMFTIYCGIMINIKNKKIPVKISVIIPTYNRAKLITKSINSVLNQTFHNFEVLIIDDNSTDNTEQEIAKINDHRIRYIKLENKQGSNFARNFGIEKAKGEYIAFQDSDDIFHEDKLEKQLKNLIDHQSDLDFCKVRLHLGRGIYNFPGPSRVKGFLKNGIFNELTYGNFISTQAILIKTNIIKQYMFDNELPRLQDYDLLLRMIPKIKVSYTKHTLVYLYVQKDSIGYSRTKLEKAKKIFLQKNYEFKSNQRKHFIKWIKRAG
jgi:glycosyltransferase involved in cell wall biosynthesis